MHLSCAISHIFAYWTFLVSVHVVFFIVECGIACFLCIVRVLCVYSMFEHHPHPLGYLCAKFRFCGALRCWPSPQRKTAYSITHSPSLFDSRETEAFASEFTFYLAPFLSYCSVLVKLSLLRGGASISLPHLGWTIESCEVMHSAIFGLTELEASLYHVVHNTFRHTKPFGHESPVWQTDKIMIIIECV